MNNQNNQEPVDFRLSPDLDAKQLKAIKKVADEYFERPSHRHQRAQILKPGLEWRKFDTQDPPEELLGIKINQGPYDNVDVKGLRLDYKIPGDVNYGVGPTQTPEATESRPMKNGEILATIILVAVGLGYIVAIFGVMAAGLVRLAKITE